MKWLGVTALCLGLPLLAQTQQASRRDGDTPKPETPPVQTVPDQPEASAPENARPPFQRIFPPAELKHLQDSADARKRDVRKVLDQIGSRELNSGQKEKVSRIRSFLQLSEQAERKNDMWTADALAEGAQVLVRELQRELLSGRSQNPPPTRRSTQDATQDATQAK